MIDVKIKKLFPDAIIPCYQTVGSVGCDLRAYIERDGNLCSIRLEPGEHKLIKTGVSIELPEGYEAQVRARSGLAYKYGIGLVNGIGSIDNDYKGEIGVILINHGKEPFVIEHGDRIAQLVVVPMIQANFIEVDEISETERGAGGFGHTGVK